MRTRNGDPSNGERIPRAYPRASQGSRTSLNDPSSNHASPPSDRSSQINSTSATMSSTSNPNRIGVHSPSGRPCKGTRAPEIRRQTPPFPPTPWVFALPSNRYRPDSNVTRDRHDTAPPEAFIRIRKAFQTHPPFPLEPCRPRPTA